MPRKTVDVRDMIGNINHMLANSTTSEEYRRALKQLQR